jgi:hypothetical protein
MLGRNNLRSGPYDTIKHNEAAVREKNFAPIDASGKCLPEVAVSYHGDPAFRARVQPGGKSVDAAAELG